MDLIKIIFKKVPCQKEVQYSKSVGKKCAEYTSVKLAADSTKVAEHSANSLCQKHSQVCLIQNEYAIATPKINYIQQPKPTEKPKQHNFYPTISTHHLSFYIDIRQNHCVNTNNSCVLFILTSSMEWHTVFLPAEHVRAENQRKSLQLQPSGSNTA